MSTRTNRFVVVEEGNPRAALVATSMSGLLFEAAAELQKYIKKITGATLPIRKPGGEQEPFLIIIGDAHQQYDLPVPKLEREGYLIRTEGNKLLITGADPDGLMFGVYTFLEKCCGVRWFWPGELGEVVPRTDTLILDKIDHRAAPAFRWRDRGPGGPLWGQYDRKTKQRMLGVCERHMEEVALWERRNKLGGLKIEGGHEWGNIVPPAKYGKDHPEYYALVDGRRDRDFDNFDGKHGAQLCTTNPNLIPVFIEYFREFFNAHPDVDVLHVTPNDGGGFCECDRCRALDTGKKLKKRPDKPVISERIFTFNNRLAQELQKIHPGKMLANMAYSWYAEPPENMVIDDHVIPQYCLWSCYLHWDEAKRDEHYALAAGWKKVARNTAIYEYFQNGAWPDLPRIVYQKIAESLRWLHGKGIDLYQAQAGDGFAINGLNYYIAAKLWWDVNEDVDALLEDYYEMAFGKGGPYVRRYYDRLISAWAESIAAGRPATCSSFATSTVHEVYSLELLAECRKELEQARAAVSEDVQVERVEFLEKGLTYTELTIRAVVLTKELENRGITISRHSFTDEEELEALTTEQQTDFSRDEQLRSTAISALEAWRERDTYVESLRDEFVISYFWVKYNDENRAFNATTRLQEIVDALV